MLKRFKIILATVFTVFANFVSIDIAAAGNVVTNNFVERSSVEVSNGTFVPALRVEIDGQSLTFAPGTAGLTRTIIFDADKAAQWATNLTGVTVQARLTPGGFDTDAAGAVIADSIDGPGF